MIRRLATIFYRWRRLTVAVWVLGVVGVTVLLGSVGSEYKQGFRPRGRRVGAGPGLPHAALPRRRATPASS